MSAHAKNISSPIGHVVFSEAGERIELTAREFVAGGGEGNVYAIDRRGFKIAHDPASACPPAKLAQLARIGDAHVLAPTGGLFARQGRRGPPVGHELPFAPQTWTACELIPMAFRRRHALPPTAILGLVAQLRDRIAAVHHAGCLVVDLSEANVLVSRDCSTALLIDVDSFQTPDFPATAIAPTIHDPTRTMGDFDESTDWFSFAVLAFSLLVGIHPFRGKHPSIKGLPARMKAGISVFDPAVRVPRACLPAASIPNPWRDWLRSTLQGRHREPPPQAGGGLLWGSQTTPRAMAASLRMRERAHADHDVRGVIETHGHLVVHAGTRVLVDGQVRLDATEAVALGLSSRGRPVAAWTEAGMLRLFDLDRQVTIPTQAAAHEVTSVRGHLFATCGDQVVRVELLELGPTIIAGLKPCVRVAPQASRLWRGAVIQQLLGTTTVSLLSEDGSAQQHRVPELDGLRIVDAVHDRQVLVVVAAEAKGYRRLVFQFRAGALYTVRQESGLPAHAAQLVVLDSGVIVSLDADERIELSRTQRGPSSIRRLDDPAVGGDWLLHPGDGHLLAAVGRRVYEVTMHRRT